jgi:FXSXX-COOH protein
VAVKSAEYETDFVDVTGIPIDQLLNLADSALSHSLLRLVREIEHPDEAVAGHEASL